MSKRLMGMAIRALLETWGKRMLAHEARALILIGTNDRNELHICVTAEWETEDVRKFLLATIKTLEEGRVKESK